MSFMTLNEIAIAVSGWDQGDDSPGTEQRTATGSLFKENTYERRSWDVETRLLTLQEADAIRGLVKGLGHHFSFDENGYSDKGLGFESGPTFSTPAKYGAKSATDASDLECDFGANYTSRWTVLAWKYVSSSWVHIARRSDGTLWDDGVTAGATEASSIDLSSGYLTLSSGRYDDLVVVPYEMPDSWVEAIAAGTQAFSALPELTLSGDAVDDVEITVLGTSPDQAFTNDGAGGRAAISFVLREKG